MDRVTTDELRQLIADKGLSYIEAAMICAVTPTRISQVVGSDAHRKTVHLPAGWEPRIERWLEDGQVTPSLWDQSKGEFCSFGPLPLSEAVALAKEKFSKPRTLRRWMRYAPSATQPSSR